MSEGMLFLANDMVYGVIVPIRASYEEEPSGFIPQSLEPNTLEFYEQKTGQDWIKELDDLVAVFPTVEGAQELMMLMFNSIMTGFPNQHISVLMEGIFMQFGGEMVLKDELSLHC